MQRVLVPDLIDPALPLAGSRILDYSGESMGTTWSVRIVDNRQLGPTHWQDGIQAQLNQVVAEMSHWEANSDLGRYNNASAGSWHKLPDGFNRVLAYALSVSAISAGAYDPSAGALINLWGFGPNGRYSEPDFAAPDAVSIAQALKVCGSQALQYDRAAARIYQPGGVQLDFSAVAKGFAVDQVAGYLEASGMRHYLIEVGGELRGAGMKPDGQPWWVELEVPELDQNLTRSVVALHGLSIATSGDYRRYFEIDGQKYAHTIDPRSGWPVATGIASVTVLHPECMVADALSTAMTVMGVTDGLRFANEYAVAACLLVRSERGFTEHVSHRFAEMMQ